jgi:hypothetical protein
MNRFKLMSLGAILPGILLLGLAGRSAMGSDEESIATTSSSHRCSVRTLKGRYIFDRKGIFIDPATKVRTDFAASGFNVYNGDGTMTGKSTSSFGGTFDRLTFTGTYTVNPDCSGTVSFKASNGFSHTADIFISEDGDALSSILTDPDNVSTAMEWRRL